MWKWITGTARPISLLAGFPVIIGAVISKTPIHWNILYAIFAAMLGVGFANSYNNVVDRKIDKLNPAKLTLAKKHPIAAWYGVLFILSLLAICMRSNQWNHCLFSILLYLSFIYSCSIGRVPILKRIVVGVINASLPMLYVNKPNLSLWLFTGFLAVLFYFREWRKDKDDAMEDNLMRFNWHKGLKLDWWCVCAPLSAPAIYLGCLAYYRQHIGMEEAAVSFGMGLAVWAYVQIRYRYGLYRMHLIHNTTSGRLNSVISLTGLMPSFVSPTFVLIAVINVFSIVHRSYLNKTIASSRVAIGHDAWLWGSVPLLAATKVGLQPGLLIASVFLAIVTGVNMSRQLRPRRTC